MLAHKNLLKKHTSRYSDGQKVGITHRFKGAVLGIESSNFVLKSAIGINGLLRQTTDVLCRVIPLKRTLWRRQRHIWWRGKGWKYGCSCRGGCAEESGCRGEGKRRREICFWDVGSGDKSNVTGYRFGADKSSPSQSPSRPQCHSRRLVQTRYLSRKHPFNPALSYLPTFRTLTQLQMHWIYWIITFFYRYLRLLARCLRKNIRRIQCWHHYLYQLYLFCCAKFFIVQKTIQLRARADSIRFRRLARITTKRVQKACPLPIVNIVVFSVNESDDLLVSESNLATYLYLPWINFSIVYPALLITNKMGVKPCRIIGDNSCTVSCLCLEVRRIFKMERLHHVQTAFTDE